jgi:hypothetical protein
MAKVLFVSKYRHIKPYVLSLIALLSLNLLYQPLKSFGEKITVLHGCAFIDGINFKNTNNSKLKCWCNVIITYYWDIFMVFLFKPLLRFLFNCFGFFIVWCLYLRRFSYISDVLFDLLFMFIKNGRISIKPCKTCHSFFGVLVVWLFDYGETTFLKGLGCIRCPFVLNSLEPKPSYEFKNHYFFSGSFFYRRPVVCDDCQTKLHHTWLIHVWHLIVNLRIPVLVVTV